MVYNEFLPIGSVVVLKGDEQRLMICGRIQARVNDTHIYDYTGCLYPEGVVDADRMFFFDHDSIEAIHFIGLVDLDEQLYKFDVLSKIDKTVLAEVLKEQVE